jgi:integrase
MDPRRRRRLVPLRRRPGPQERLPTLTNNHPTRTPAKLFNRITTLPITSMEDGTPVEVIADILGHQSVASTGAYLKSSIGLLSACALDPDQPVTGVSR